MSLRIGAQQAVHVEGEPLTIDHSKIKKRVKVEPSRGHF